MQFGNGKSFYANRVKTEQAPLSGVTGQHKTDCRVCFVVEFLMFYFTLAFLACFLFGIFVLIGILFVLFFAFSFGEF